MLDYIYSFVNNTNKPIKQNIIEGRRNRRRNREQKAISQNEEALVEQRYRQAAAYVNTKGLTTESALLGPDYQYSDYIKGPGDIGMSSRGSMDVLEKDVEGLFAYVDLLVKGKSKAAKGNEILGPQSFIPTGATCQLDIGGGKEETVQRYLYNTFKPTGNIPIDGGDGVVRDARGLIPGLVENAVKLNPLDMFESFLDVNPKCMLLKMPVTIPGQGTVPEEKPVSITDIGQMDPCTFQYYGNKNFVSGRICEAFENIYDKTETIYNKTYIEIDDMFDTQELYALVLSSLGIYVVLRAMNINIDE